MKVFKIAFYLALIGMVITGSMVLQDRMLLKTEHAPQGMLSLQLSSSTARQKQIIKEWDSLYVNQQVYSRDTVITERLTALKVAQKQTAADDYFIFFYVAVLCLLYWRYRHELSPWQPLHPRKWLWLVASTLLAGLFDIIENAYLLQSMSMLANGPPPEGAAWQILVPAVLKLVFLLIPLLYFFFRINGLNKVRQWLQRLSALLHSFVLYGWKFRLVLIGLLVLFLALSVTNQGQDLLVTINTSDWGIFWFFSVTTVLALLNWHLPKIYDNLDQINLKRMALESLQFETDKRQKLDFARLLGVMTYLIPATGVLLTMHAYHISYPLDAIPPLVLLLVISVLYVNALRYQWLDVIYKPRGTFSLRRYLLTMAIIFGLIIYWGRSEQTRVPYYLIYLSLGFFFLSFAFVVTVSYRTCILLVKNVPVAPLILGAGFICTLVFIAFNIDSIVFYLTRHDRFYTLPVVISGLVAYTLVFSFLLITGKKMHIQLITLFLVLVIYRSAVSITSIHKIHQIPTHDPAMKRTSLRDYSRQWLENRKTEIKLFQQQYPGKGYPLFFVNAYGGGIKAAAWTTMVIGRLDQLLSSSEGSRPVPHDFQHYVFSYSGVSGGTVGLSLLTAARLQHPGADPRFFPGRASQLFQHDYLTATLAALLGRDALQSLIGAKLYPDRARVQEKNWESHLATYRIDYTQPFAQAGSQTAGAIPLLFSNTYDINSGFKGILAPLKLQKEDFPGAIFLTELMADGQDLQLSTAALISARFPYVSPTAKFDEKHHFTDGGTLENSGAETSLQVFQVFKSILDSLQREDPEFADLRFNISFLSLPNSIPVLDSVQRTKNLYEPLAPALGILNSTNGNTVKADTINRYLARKNNWNYFSVNPVVKKIEVDVWPVLPLGWQISDYALQQMELNIIDHESPLYKVIQVFPMYKPLTLPKAGRSPD